MIDLTRRDVLKSGAALFLGTAVGGTSRLFGQEAKKPDPYADAVRIDGEPAPISPGSFTIAVLPDTQHYSQKVPENYFAQTKWIADNRDARRIAYVLHLGDITNTSAREEWEVAQKAMNALDGVVPYCIVPGNHDYSEKGRCQDRTTLLSEYFPVAKYKSTPTFGGVYDKEPEKMENNFHLFSVDGRDLMVVGLEFGPRKDVIRWANEVVGDHPKREVILTTHAYMYYDDTRYDWGKYGTSQTWNPHNYGVAKSTNDDVNDGQELWDQLVSKHENFILTLNGHVLNDGLGRVTTATPGGRDVHQMLVNFQMRPNGGDGWMRLIEFCPDGLAKICDYSPVLGQRNESSQNFFDLQLAKPV